MSKLKIGSLFSGYGGLSLATEQVFDGEVVWHCEFEDAPSKVLEQRWPDVPNLGDITKIDWEQVLGRIAPDPTEAGPKGGRRLAAAFVEWMMGLPVGWVTGVHIPSREATAKALSGVQPATSRAQQLKMLGNGVVTQQAVAALESMLPLTPTQLSSLARFGVTGADLKGEHDER